MSVNRKQEGEDIVWEQVDRKFGGARKEALRIDGEDGSVKMGNPVGGVYPLEVDADGEVTIVGADISGGAITDDTEVASGKDLTFAGGDSVFDASAASGVFKTSTGTNTLGGDVVISGAKTLTTGTGLTTVSGDLLMAAAKIVGFGAPQSLSGVGACNVTTLVTLFTSTGGAQALSLADGTQAGQLKIVHHTVDGGSGVLTPTTAGNFATFTLTNIHDACLLQWSGTAWNILLNVGGTVG